MSLSTPGSHGGSLSPVEAAWLLISFLSETSKLCLSDHLCQRPPLHLLDDVPGEEAELCVLRKA